MSKAVEIEHGIWRATWGGWVPVARVNAGPWFISRRCFSMDACEAMACAVTDAGEIATSCLSGGAEVTVTDVRIVDDRPMYESDSKRARGIWGLGEKGGGDEEG